MSKYSKTYEESNVKYRSKVKKMLAHLDSLCTLAANERELAGYDEEFRVYETTLTKWFASNDRTEKWAVVERTWKPKESLGSSE